MIVDDNKTPDDPSDDLTYTGVALWRLVGRVDDGSPARFDRKRATTAPGYNVVVTAVDGFSATYTSVEVATLKNKLVVANRLNGVPLDLGTASIKNPMTEDEYAAWKPNWPLKLVSSDTAIFGNRKPAGVARISIVPATKEARAADTGVPYGWLLQLRGFKQRDNMTSGAFKAWTRNRLVKRRIVDDNKTPDDPSDDLTYTGVALWRLVGRVDDGSPGALRPEARHHRAGLQRRRHRGGRLQRHLHQRRGRDAEEQAGRRQPAERRAARLGTASIKNPMTEDEYATWKPNWPLKLVSSDTAIFGNRKPAGVARISIVPASTPGAAPFEQGVSVETAAPAATADPDDPPPGGWTLTLKGRRTVVMRMAKFPATVRWDGTKAGNINPSLKYVYKGQSLYKLLAKVDDNRPGSFNLARAKKGYTIQVHLP